tara:strand:+ start:1655 stop:1774 length:120 start_codon:yes stop_codon:yes gene_type:complete
MKKNKLQRELKEIQQAIDNMSKVIEQVINPKRRRKLKWI